ncbi:carbohydrate ABC transporter permease [Cohnella luojiensis]|uniref:Carbohydrate ABC transporter permease n=1 Tax=Cohnella luojiensis TaxID=652876 RepID=A0A4Y8LWF4_9BACL|nr:carbohydrate ABC transporter permease [Cohnella luojiensis]TFE26090.1 carbohydrate ABC transporter permease [Cohnella luojiensis]
MEYVRMKQPAGDRMFTISNYTLLTVFFLIILYPLIFVLSASVSDPSAVVSGKVWLWPVKPNLMGYEAVFKHKLIGSGFLNSFYYTAFGTAINVVMTLLAAYPLSRKDFYGKNAIMFLFVFTTMFSGGLIPGYLLVKDLNMLNTVWAMVLPGALSVWNVIITRTYFQTAIPPEMLEAAQMDGCNDFKYVWKIIIPLAGPILAVITLFYAVGHWNQFFSALIFLDKQNMYPLQIILRDILIQNDVSALMLSDIQDAARREALRVLLKYSLIVVSTLPLMLLYPFVQKHFVKGVMIGSLKG